MARLSSASPANRTWAFAAGVLVFSGSLYVLVLTGRGWLGAITPIGGTALIVGWIALAAALLALAGCSEPAGLVIGDSVGPDFEVVIAEFWEEFEVFAEERTEPLAEVTRLRLGQPWPPSCLHPAGRFPRPG